MQPDTSKPVYAGGILILIGFIAGSAIGISRGEPSLGAILGVGAGAAIALVLWLLARARTR